MSFFTTTGQWLKSFGDERQFLAEPDLSFEQAMSYSAGILLLVNAIGLGLALMQPGRDRRFGPSA